jgi:hypothetical protein
MKEETRIGFGLVLMTILTIAILILITQVIPPIRTLPEENVRRVSDPPFGYYELSYLLKEADGPYTDRIEKKLEAKQFDASGNRIFTQLN